MSKVSKKLIGPEAFAALDALTDEAMAKQTQKGRRVTASEAIAKDDTAKPYSVRMTARELYQLKLMSEMENAKPAELARNLILQGMLQLEAKHVEAPEGQSEKLQDLYRLRSELAHMLTSVNDAITHASEMVTVEDIAKSMRVTVSYIDEARAKVHQAR